MADRVLVTGINGFIAKHVALALLNAGLDVVGTVRNAAAADQARATLANHGGDTARLSFAEADLGSDAGWAEAVAGCRYVQHVAAPFPMKQPRGREALVPAARGGALRVLEAALKAEVERVVLTSSSVAMMYRPGRPPEVTVTEDDWTDAEWPALNAYIVAKTRAERAAWDFVRARGRADWLTTVNPGFVLGPALDGRIGTSLGVIELILKGTYPALPPVALPIVDLRDVADLHVKAMTVPEAASRRLIGAGETLTMLEMAGILRAAFPAYARKIPRRELPALLIRTMALVDPNMKSVTPNLGTRPVAASGYVTAMTGVAFRPAQEAVLAAGESLIAHKLV